ncbi:MAG TPA: hypothetical protein DCY56_06020 [Candidatus Omnitrophica bacterium]|nr:hypothetical protein [Candidatus Omnitrophota bacterium]
MTQFTANSHLTCVSCGADTPRPLFKKACAKQDIELLQCRICSMVFLRPWQKTGPIALYDYYGQRMHLKKNELYSQATEASFKELLEIFEKSGTRGKRILDVGCGDGHFIDVCSKQGWDASGIETSPSAVALCRKFNLPVQCLDLFSPELKPGSFNVITLFEVVEHVASPGPFLARAEELLALGGMLYLTTPNFASIDSRILKSDWYVVHWEHLNYFTPKALKKLVCFHTKLAVKTLKTRNISLGLLNNLVKGKKRNRPNPGKAYYNLNNPCVNQEQRLRELASKLPVLGLAKKTVNGLLNLFGGGSTITLLTRKVYA